MKPSKRRGGAVCGGKRKPPSSTPTLNDVLQPRGSAVRLAERLQISTQYLSEIRRGRREPNLGLGLAIECETGVSAWSLVLNEKYREWVA